MREQRSLKPKRVDDQYIQKLEDMMEQRRLKEVESNGLGRANINYRNKRKNKNAKRSKPKS